MDLNCTKCGSDHTQKVSAIYSQGTSRGSASSSSTTVGAVGDRAAVAATSTSTSSFSQTDLAEQLQPPQMKRSTWFFPAIGVGIWLGWVGAFLGLIVGAIVVKVLRMNGDNVGLFVFAGVIWAFWRSFVQRVCYDADQQYMIVMLNDTYYHYCEIDDQTVDALINASSVGEYFNQHIKGDGSDGPFDCRTHRVPTYE